MKTKTYKFPCVLYIFINARNHIKKILAKEPTERSVLFRPYFRSYFAENLYFLIPSLKAFSNNFNDFHFPCISAPCAKKTASKPVRSPKQTLPSRSRYPSPMKYDSKKSELSHQSTVHLLQIKRFVNVAQPTCFLPSPAKIQI